MKLFCNEWDVLNLLKNWGICRWNFRETIWVVSRLQGASNYFIVQVLVPWRLFDSPCWCCSFIRCSWRLERSTTPHFRTLPKYSECNLFFHGKSSRPHAHCDRIGQAVLEMAELARTRFNFASKYKMYLTYFVLYGTQYDRKGSKPGGKINELFSSTIDVLILAGLELFLRGIGRL